MLRPDPDSDQARRDALQDGQSLHEPQRPRHRRFRRAGQHAAQKPILDGELKRLRRPRGKLTPPLDCAQVVDAHGAVRQRISQDICGRHASWMARLMPTPPIGDIA